MSDESNALDDLIGGLRSRSKKAPVTPSPAPKQGLNPLDLLDLPLIQRELITYLSHQKQANLAELQQANPTVSQSELEQALRALKEAGSIREAFIDGQIHYRVAFGGVSNRSKIFLPENIWNRLNPDNLTFLQQMPMFHGLSKRKLVQIAGQMNTHHFHRNEIIIRQDEPSEQVYLIKSGIVGISHLMLGNKSSQVLAYLKQGDILGEIGILGNRSRTATATAMSEVEVLELQRDVFLELLHKYNSTALELAKILGHQLVATTNRLGQNQQTAHMVLVFRLAPGAGCTTISSALATVLAQETQQPTVYTEYPALQTRPAQPATPREESAFHHPAGYDIWLPYADPSLPVIADTTLLVDHLLSHYSNIVIGVTGEVDDSVAYMLERANQAVLVVPPDPAVWPEGEQLLASLKERGQKSIGILTIINRPQPEQRDLPPPGPADFDIPYLDTVPHMLALPQTEATLPEPLLNVVQALADRLERTREIGVYIPTTIEVDQSFDTSPYVDKTLAFLGELFGGATSSQAQGVWNSDEAGLVNEAIHIVRAFTTRANLNRHLDTVLAFVESLKAELKQEAMALEVDQRLILV
jgi:CRP-like cAMP-binding protein